MGYMPFSGLGYAFLWFDILTCTDVSHIQYGCNTDYECSIVSGTATNIFVTDLKKKSINFVTCNY